MFWSFFFQIMMQIKSDWSFLVSKKYSSLIIEATNIFMVFEEDFNNFPVEYY